MLTFQQVEATPRWWAFQAKFSDRLIQQTEEWIRFIAESQDATPVLAEIRDGSSQVGCFCGLIITRFGIGFWVAHSQDGPLRTWVSIWSRTSQDGWRYKR